MNLAKSRLSLVGYNNACGDASPRKTNLGTDSCPSANDKNTRSAMCNELERGKEEKSGLRKFNQLKHLFVVSFKNITFYSELIEDKIFLRHAISDDVASRCQERAIARDTDQAILYNPSTV